MAFYQQVGDGGNQAGERSLGSTKDLDTEPNRPP